MVTAGITSHDMLEDHTFQGVRDAVKRRVGEDAYLEA